MARVYNDTFPAIAVQQPWADLIVDGKKDVENRSRHTRFQGNILIHASMKVRWDDVAAHRRSLGLGADEEYDPTLGALIGMVEIVDCVSESRSRWFQKGRYGLVLRNAVRFRSPIPFHGWQAIPFQVPAKKLVGTSAASARPGWLIPK